MIGHVSYFCEGSMDFLVAYGLASRRSLYERTTTYIEREYVNRGTKAVDVRYRVTLERPIEMCLAFIHGAPLYEEDI